MFEDFLNHTCNIYHLEKESVTVGYGIMAEGMKCAAEKPDEKNVCCHFNIRENNQIRIEQKEPYSSIAGDLKLTLPIGTDIRMNDIVEDCRNGLKYRAGIPKEVHGGHHIVVTLSRKEGVRSAI